MLIKDSGISTEIKDQMLEASLQKIGILLYSVATALTAADLDQYEVAIYRSRKGGGSTPILYPTSLRTILEIAASEEGHFRTLGANLFQIIGVIDVSKFGTLLLDDEYLTVSVKNLAVVLTGVKIYSLEGDEYNRSSIEYIPNTVLAGTPKNVNVADCYKIALPIANLEKLVLNYADGRTASYEPCEIAMLCCAVNDVVSAIKTAAGLEVVTGYDKMYCLPIENVVTAVVHYATQTKFFTLRNV